MKILMVGALYFANFGDLLFSKLFYNELLKNHSKEDIYIYETPVYRLNEACRQELSYENHFQLSMLKDMDALVYISGGYFSVRSTSPKAHLMWYLKYALPGSYFAKQGKKIYVLGVGGGDFLWKPGENISKRILNAAKVVCVRNVETKEKLEAIGVNNEIVVHSDTAQAIKTTAPAVSAETQSQKRLFLHVIPLADRVELMMENVFPAVKHFLERHPEYRVVVGCDGVIKEKHRTVLENIVKYLGSDRAEIYDYASIDGMIDVLSGCDMVVTPKLHAGIVGCALGKSVFALPVDPNKTNRYYADIGHPERCCSLKETSEQVLLDLLEKYAEIGVVIPSEKVESAKGTLQFCSNI